MCSFYDWLSKYVRDKSSDMRGFVKEWDKGIEEKRIDRDGDGGMRLVSIDKSKGVE